MKISTEIQQNVKLLQLLKEKAICLTLTEQKNKNAILRQNWKRPLWRALACTFTDSTELFCFKMESEY